MEKTTRDPLMLPYSSPVNPAQHKAPSRLLQSTHSSSQQFLLHHQKGALNITLSLQLCINFGVNWLGTQTGRMM